MSSYKYRAFHPSAMKVIDRCIKVILPNNSKVQMVS